MKLTANFCSSLLEVIGTSTIALLALYAMGHSVVMLYRAVPAHEILQRARNELVGGLLLGLEFLVAGDIIRTVAVDLSLTVVALLAAIVAIRTFLSITLEVEMNGRFPWQAPKDEPSQPST